MPVTPKFARRQRIFALVGACTLVLWSMPAYAYLDPATGSVILQGILAGVAGLMVVLRMYWARVKRFWRRLWGRPESETEVGIVADAEGRNPRR
jgi:hypothetical protein